MNMNTTATATATATAVTLLLLESDRLLDFVPAELYSSKDPAQWAADILQQAQLLGRMAPIVAQSSYLNIVQDAPQYVPRTEEGYGRRRGAKRRWSGDGAEMDYDHVMTCSLYVASRCSVRCCGAERKRVSPREAKSQVRLPRF